MAIPLQLVERYCRLVATLDGELDRDVHRARGGLHQIVGDEIRVVPHESGKHLVARVGLEMRELVQAAGNSEILMVAGE